MLTGSGKFCKLIDMLAEPPSTLIGILLAAAGSAFLVVFFIVLIVDAACENRRPRFSLRAAVLFVLSFGLLIVGLSHWKQADEANSRYEEQKFLNSLENELTGVRNPI
jgi:high-affinity Fe2+/Pb2+ permease